MHCEERSGTGRKKDGVSRIEERHGERKNRVVVFAGANIRYARHGVIHLRSVLEVFLMNSYAAAGAVAQLLQLPNELLPGSYWCEPIPACNTDLQSLGTSVPACTRHLCSLRLSGNPCHEPNASCGSAYLYAKVVSQRTKPAETVNSVNVDATQALV